MKSLKLLFIVFASVLYLAGCTNRQTAENTKSTTKNETSVSGVSGEDTEYIALTDSTRKELIKKGKEASRKMAAVLQKHLKKAIKENGLEYAIRFCNTKAMELTDSVSDAEAVHIRRLAKKFRNPANETDPEESELFKSYILDWLASKPLSPQIIPDSDGHPVYYDPIYVGTVCLNCHGEPNTNISPSVMATIQELYPDDKATNFKKGQLRGMWAITFTDYKVK